MRSEPYLGNYRPPVTLRDRKVEFVCQECGRPGWGPPNARTHPGKCRRERVRKTAAKNAARDKKKREASAV